MQQYLPQLGEVIDVVRQHHAPEEERRSEAALVHQLEGHVLACEKASEGEKR